MTGGALARGDTRRKCSVTLVVMDNIKGGTGVSPVWSSGGSPKSPIHRAFAEPQPWLTVAGEERIIRSF